MIIFLINTSNVIDKLNKKKKRKKMRKADLINRIADKTGVPKVDVLVTIESFFKEIKTTMSQGENIYIRGFGTYLVKKRAAKIGRNIKKNLSVHIPEHYIPAFKPSKEFTAELKHLKPENIKSNIEETEIDA
jgi:DNA-binding protein HU-beta